MLWTYKTKSLFWYPELVQLKATLLLLGLSIRRIDLIRHAIRLGILA